MEVEENMLVQRIKGQKKKPPEKCIPQALMENRQLQGSHKCRSQSCYREHMVVKTREHGEAEVAVFML